MEQLLLVTTTQTNELIASFQDRFNNLKSDHDNSLRKLLRNSKSERHHNQIIINRITKNHNKQISRLESEYRDNQTSIDGITKNHNKQMSQLESEYRVSLTQVENQHNKKIS